MRKDILPCMVYTFAAWSSAAAAVLGSGSEEAGPYAELGRDPAPAMSASSRG